MLKVVYGHKVSRPHQNEKTWKAMEIPAMEDKLRKKHLGWFGHLVRGRKSHIRRHAVELAVEGTRTKGRPE